MDDDTIELTETQRARLELRLKNIQDDIDFIDRSPNRASVAARHAWLKGAKAILTELLRGVL